MEFGAESSTFFAYESIDFVIVRIKGFANYSNAPLFNKFLSRTLDRNYIKYCIIFDECTGIDSTCLGILAGLLLKLRAKHGICLFCGLKPRQLECVRIVGLDRFVHIVDHMPSSLAEANHEIEQNLPQSPLKISPELILEAHKFLMEISEHNKMHFKDVVLLLEKNTNT